MLLHSFIEKLNSNISEMIPGMKVYGLARTVTRKQGSESQTLPCVVSKDGEATYIGIDNDFSVIVYHRNPSITTGRSTRPGTGDGLSDLVNTYQMAMIVFIDHEKAKLYPEELFLFLQANIPDAIKFDPYKTIFIRTTNIILNSQLVFAAEYAGTDFFLPAEKSLFQINYTIESTFKKDCFAKCPEDC
jgi:hypothetical protein